MQDLYHQQQCLLSCVSSGIPGTAMLCLVLLLLLLLLSPSLLVRGDLSSRIVSFGTSELGSVIEEGKLQDWP